MQLSVYFPDLLDYLPVQIPGLGTFSIDHTGKTFCTMDLFRI